MKPCSPCRSISASLSYPRSPYPAASSRQQRQRLPVIVRHILHHNRVRRNRHQPYTAAARYRHPTPETHPPHAAETPCRFPFAAVAVPKNFRSIGGGGGGPGRRRRWQRRPGFGRAGAIGFGISIGAEVCRKNIPPAPRVHQRLRHQHRLHLQRRIELRRSRPQLLRRLPRTSPAAVAATGRSRRRRSPEHGSRRRRRRSRLRVADR